jgi:hypothetical protein
MAKPGVMPGTGSAAPGKKKRLPYSHLLPQRKVLSDPASVGETPPAPTNAFAAESGRPATFSVRTTHSDPEPAPSECSENSESALPCSEDEADGFTDPSYDPGQNPFREGDA